MRLGRILVSGACVALFVSFCVGCEGPTGPAGAPGKNGTVGKQGDAGVVGAPGQPGANGTDGLEGPAGQPAGVPLALESNGLVGVVRDPSGQTLPNGTIYLVPATDVAALAKTALDITVSPTDAKALATDEPLEDLLDANASTYTSTKVGADGSYRFTALASGSYFIVFEPAAADAYHLPGGDHCRQATDTKSLIGTQLDLRVSGRQSDKATYVGSTACFGCHGRHRSMRSAHRLGLEVPGVRSAYQDTTHWPAFDAGLQSFTSGTKLYFYGCSAAATGDAKCQVSATDPTVATPAAVISFELRLAHDATVPHGEPGEYTMEIVNRLGSGSTKYPVVLTYGGSVYRQHYLTRRTNANGTFSYYVLPLQFNTEGSNTYPSSDDWVWKDYHSEAWYDFANSKLAEPGNASAFDNNCAGCHMTGFKLTGNATDGWNAHAVGDANAEFDFDGDGKREEINTGCEACHGPASEHLEAKVRGVRIVSPSLVTPERSALICGRCHSRPQGIGGGGTETPLSSDGLMARPGIRRSDFAAGFTTRVDGAASDFHASGDSKSNHQQYTDFVRSKMYRNQSVLMTCSNCHDAHGNDDNEHQLLKAQTDNSACTACHNAEEFTSPRKHLLKQVNYDHAGVEDTAIHCVDCHMVGTVAAGARRPGLVDLLPVGATPVAYYQGDIASHRFTVTRRIAVDLQPVAATQQCAACHGKFFPNP